MLDISTQSEEKLTDYEEVQATDAIPDAVPAPAPRKIRPKRAYQPHINIRLRNLKAATKQTQLLITTLCPLRQSHLDMETDTKDEVDLEYLCGLYDDIDHSFNFRTLPDHELLTALQHQNSKNLNIYIHGHIDGMNAGRQAAQDVLDECIALAAGLPFHIVPFLWPSQGYLAAYDADFEAEKICGAKLAWFVRRLWSHFESVNIIAHGRGNNLMMIAAESLAANKPEILESCQLISIAPDMPEDTFRGYVSDLKDLVTRITLYTNTWDWKLWASKWLNWSNERAGSSVVIEEGLDTVDATPLVPNYWIPEWNSNHYYLSDERFRRDLEELLTVPGGKPPQHRFRVERDDYYVGAWRLIP